jgi:hypothetical protein
MSKNITFLVVLIAFFSSLFLQAQTNDSNFVFQSPRPLISGESPTSDFKYAAGGDLLFTESGFGGGIFYDIRINKSISLEFDVSLTYLRASDEFEQLVLNEAGDAYIWMVPGKIRRLWRMPITVGIRYEPFGSVLSDNFKPYITAGGGTGIILETPYPYPFFQSLNYLKAYAKPAMYVGFGADFTGKSARTSRVFVKYYFIPYGGEGIESVEGLPISNCGGLFLGINFGGGWK